jgi:hypothetical protein
MLNCDFAKRSTAFLKITFFKSHFLKSQTQTDHKSNHVITGYFSNDVIGAKNTLPEPRDVLRSLGLNTDLLCSGIRLIGFKSINQSPKEIILTEDFPT